MVETILMRRRKNTPPGRKRPSTIGLWRQKFLTEKNGVPYSPRQYPLSGLIYGATRTQPTHDRSVAIRLRLRGQNYDLKEVWVEVFTKLLKDNRIIPQLGHKSFSVACKLLPMVKQSFPDAPFVIDEFGRVAIPAGFAAKASWKNPAWEAMKKVFGFDEFKMNKSAKSEYGKSLSLCIPNFMSAADKPSPLATHIVVPVAAQPPAVLAAAQPASNACVAARKRKLSERFYELEVCKKFLTDAEYKNKRQELVNCL